MGGENGLEEAGEEEESSHTGNRGDEAEVSAAVRETGGSSTAEGSTAFAVSDREGSISTC